MADDYETTPEDYRRRIGIRDDLDRQIAGMTGKKGAKADKALAGLQNRRGVIDTYIPKDPTLAQRYSSQMLRGMGSDQ